MHLGAASCFLAFATETSLFAIRSLLSSWILYGRQTAAGLSMA
ncbi:hypothetical protein RBSWK_03076 [Rhodopirellula baltica SWK14]|uniref:Uncharacterized protein n=1 Tax=Rhodopirellula baltica SWK14 TaxID=993516 RepID=L7CIN2_RHOBT|nr:hypothetical protein RBSWK_03076 [Rhodopirellula baltica SWK14]